MPSGSTNVGGDLTEIPRGKLYPRHRVEPAARWSPVRGAGGAHDHQPGSSGETHCSGPFGREDQAGQRAEADLEAADDLDGDGRDGSVAVGLEVGAVSMVASGWLGDEHRRAATRPGLGAEHDGAAALDGPSGGQSWLRPREAAVSWTRVVLDVVCADPQ